MRLTRTLQAVPGAIKRRLRRFGPEQRAKVDGVHAIAERIADQAAQAPFDSIPSELARSYQPTAWARAQEFLPLTYFDQQENYGDLLSPWLLARMSGRPVRFADRRAPHFVMVGSIIGDARDAATVWGSGSYGVERPAGFNKRATYTEVRGPLTRSRLLNVGIDCPRVYGDPALLMPLYFAPQVTKTHRVGIVIRHTEDRWRGLEVGPDVRLIDLKTTDVESTTREMLECDAIISSSLHGLIIADAYGIPNVWLDSDAATGGSRPFGGEFKFYDYFASVDKMRHAQPLEVPASGALTADHLHAPMDFDGRPIRWDAEALLEACPFVGRAPVSA